ncbi:ER membrane protein DP1/Yop1 [Thoreauomyces humboldtii]|nr:ER membrane protein DP1/Yop1 [Thoreauomyces humboldtii]
MNTLNRIEFQLRLAALDRVLSTIPLVVALERSLGIQKVHLAGLLSVSLIILVLVLNNTYAGFITDIVGFFYPAIMSLKSVGGPPALQGQWLGYWTVFGSFHLIEYAIDTVLSVFPYYYTFKLGAVIWMILPSTQGASLIYLFVLRPIVPLVDGLFLASFFGPRRGVVVPIAPAAEAAHGKVPPVVLVPTDNHAHGPAPVVIEEKKVEGAKVRWGYVKVR